MSGAKNVPAALKEQIQDQRRQLQEAAALVEVCQLSVDIETDYSLHSALGTAYTMLDRVVEALDMLGSGVEVTVTQAVRS